MTQTRILVLQGDGIGPEVTHEALRVLQHVAKKNGIGVELDHQAFGGASIDQHGVPATDTVLKQAQSVDAVLLGAVGGPKWDVLDPAIRPEKGLLALREAMGVFANIRPAKLFAALGDACPLKNEVANGFDFVVVRELIGDVYFGKPRGIETRGGEQVGFNTMIYSEHEVERIARVAFETARLRKKKLCSVDKANVLDVSRLWRDVVNRVSKAYPDVTLSHMYVDNCAMQLALNPSQFDVIVTGNIFGDILSDLAGAVTGSIGLLPSASLGQGAGLYEPIHGSAPDIAGQGKANPLATVLSVAMLFEHSLKQPQVARQIETAVQKVLEQGLRTADLARHASSVQGVRHVNTTQMTDAVLAQL